MNIIKLHKNNFNSKNKMKDEILIGLKDNPKYISSKYFYDEKGALLYVGKSVNIRTTSTRT